MKNPCYKCEDRKMICHDNCKLYKEYMEFRNKVKKKKEEEQMDHNIFWRDSWWMK